MSKLSFRARALDAGKPMPIYMAEELPDLPDFSAINRAVPQMPSGMQKEEESEHHLQRAICAGLIIPTPEVCDMPHKEFYDKVYPANYKQPRQLIHMQPFTMEQDIPDYDMDSEDERWLQSQTQRLDLSALKFEEMMDRLEKSSGQTVVTLNEAKALLKEDDDLIIAVFDYWLNKRLKTQHPLILTVKTEHRAGTAANNPYLAFRRRTEKMQTRKNRKNDEASYEKMLKLRRDLYRAVTLLELVKRREKIKREYVHLTVEVFEKRYQAKDFNGAIMAEASAIKSSRPAFTPIFHNHYTNQASWSTKAVLKDEVIPRREKRPYKKRTKHKSLSQQMGGTMGAGAIDAVNAMSSDEDALMSQLSPENEETEEDGPYVFKRNKLCSYHMPLPMQGNWPWCSMDDRGSADNRYRFTLTSLLHPRRRCIGFARRRLGRGGRVILDRVTTSLDDYWRTLDFSILEPESKTVETAATTEASSRTTDIANASVVNAWNSSSVGPVNNMLHPVDVKNELLVSAGASRTSFGDNGVASSVFTKVIEQQRDEVMAQAADTGPKKAEATIHQHTKEEHDDMVDFLQSVRKEWLHFRPKTPPPEDEESMPTWGVSVDNTSDLMACHPFTMEIQSLVDESEAPSALVDTSTFLTDPYLLETANLDMEVPITDTRQAQQQSDSCSLTSFNSGSSSSSSSSSTPPSGSTPSSVYSLTPTPSATSITSTTSINGLVAETELLLERMSTAGCSTFTLKEYGNNATSRLNVMPLLGNGLITAANSVVLPPLISQNKTLSSGSPNKNNHGGATGNSPQQGTTDIGHTVSRIIVPELTPNTNGLVPHFGSFDVSAASRTNNKHKLYAYSGAMGYSNASGPGTFSLHTTAHTLTLNSHSANLLEIPMTADEADSMTDAKLEAAGTATATAASAGANANTSKTIVRKNNLIMEVT